LSSASPLTVFLFGLAIWFIVVARIFKCTHKRWAPDVGWKVSVGWHNSHNHQKHFRQDKVVYKVVFI
jgi:hypothetical protein